MARRGSRLNQDRRDAAFERSVKSLDERHAEARQQPPPYEVRKLLRERTLEQLRDGDPLKEQDLIIAFSAALRDVLKNDFGQQWHWNTACAIREELFLHGYDVKKRGA